MAKGLKSKAPDSGFTAFSPRGSTQTRILFYAWGSSERIKEKEIYRELLQEQRCAVDATYCPDAWALQPRESDNVT